MELKIKKINLCGQTYKVAQYAIIGASTYIITNVCLYVSRRIYFWADMPAISLSYALAITCHFLLNNAITFKKSKEPLRKRIGGHLSVAAINYLVGVTVASSIIAFVVDNNIIASGCSTAATLVLGYKLLNRYVYKVHNTNQEGTVNDNSEKPA